MTNKEKKLYISTMTEYNRRCYNNGETNNFIGKIASLQYQFFLKLELTIKYKEPYKTLRKQFMSISSNDKH